MGGPAGGGGGREEENGKLKTERGKLRGGGRVVGDADPYAWIVWARCVREYGLPHK